MRNIIFLITEWLSKPLRYSVRHCSHCFQYFCPHSMRAFFWLNQPYQPKARLTSDIQAHQNLPLNSFEKECASYRKLFLLFNSADAIFDRSTFAAAMALLVNELSVAKKIKYLNILLIYIPIRTMIFMGIHNIRRVIYIWSYINLWRNRFSKKTLFLSSIYIYRFCWVLIMR